MPFVLRKEHPASPYPRYVAVRPAFENHVNPNAVDYDPDMARATRFRSREEAERWQAELTGGSGTVVINVKGNALIETYTSPLDFRDKFDR
jgi:hypothetical protein